MTKRIVLLIKAIRMFENRIVTLKYHSEELSFKERNELIEQCQYHLRGAHTALVAEIEAEMEREKKAS